MRQSRSILLSIGVLFTGSSWILAQTPVRVATWNVESVGVRGQSQYEAAIDILNRIGADVVGINEINGTGEIDDFRNLAQDAGYAHSVVPDTNPFGELRNGFLSKLPILRTTTHTSSTLSGDADANDIARLIIEIRVDVPANPHDLTLVVEHWKSSDSNEDEYRRAIEGFRMAQTVADLDSSVDAYVAMGDVNEEADTVPRFPNPLTEIPSGLPISFHTGSDIRSLLNGAGLENNPFHYLLLEQGPNMTILDARQKDGSDVTRNTSGRRLDYLFVSPAVARFNPRSEVYDSRDEGLSGGLPKFGNALPSNTSALASDHFLVFADIQVPGSDETFYGDFDRDQDADLRDIAFFMNCFEGPGQPVRPECEEVDQSDDGDVDLPDYRVFFSALTGPLP